MKTEIATRALTILKIASVVVLAGCGGGANQVANNQAPPPGASNPVPNPVSNLIPMVTSISPNCAPQGELSLNPFANGQLSVYGQNFAAGSVVLWNGNNRPTTFRGSTALTVQVSAADIATVGTAAVTVVNPAPDGGTSNSLTFTTMTGGEGPQSITVDPAGKFAYVVNQGCGDSAFGNVSMYTIDPTSGALASIGPPVDSNDEGGGFVTAYPSGRFIYVANWGGGDTVGSVSSYVMNTTGALISTGTISAPGAPPPSPGATSPWSMTVDPSGKFAYVANEGGYPPTSISTYSIDPASGVLTFIGLIPSAGRASSVTVHPSGEFAYVTNASNGFPGENNNVAIYAIKTGTLAFIGTVAAELHPSSIAIHPSGKFAYVTNLGSNDASMFAIDASTGVLMPMGPIAVGSEPAFVVVDPTGKFAYVANSVSNDVSIFTINATTGALTSAGRMAVGLSPSSIAIHPSGKFAYVTNFGSNSVSVFSIDAATGALTLIGTIGT